MAEIKNIYEDSARTQDIYPITHEKAVIDNNGTTAETKFKMITNLVNQKQMEVGAVPSDLTPTEGSTNWVTSGGVYDAIATLDKDTLTTTWTSGKGIKASDGTFDNNTNLEASDYIDVRGYKSIIVGILDASAINGLALYDSAKAFVRGYSGTGTSWSYVNTTLDVTDFAYIRLTAAKQSSHAIGYPDMIGVKKVVTFNNVENTLKEEQSGKVLDARQGKVLLDFVNSGDIEVDEFIWTEGNIKISDGNAENAFPGLLYYSNYIDLLGCDKVTTKYPASSVTGAAFYDSNKVFIMGVSSSNISQAGYEVKTVLIPSTAKYIRITAYQDVEQYGEQIVILGTSRNSAKISNVAYPETTDGYAVNANDGTIGSTSAISVTTFLRTYEADFLWIDAPKVGSSYAGVAFYNGQSTSAYVGGYVYRETGEHGWIKIPIPKDAKFFRASFYASTHTNYYTPKYYFELTTFEEKAWEDAAYKISVVSIFRNAKVISPSNYKFAFCAHSFIYDDKLYVNYWASEGTNGDSHAGTNTCMMDSYSLFDKSVTNVEQTVAAYQDTEGNAINCTNIYVGPTLFVNNMLTSYMNAWKPNVNNPYIAYLRASSPSGLVGGTVTSCNLSYGGNTVVFNMQNYRQMLADLEWHGYVAPSQAMVDNNGICYADGTYYMVFNSNSLSTSTASQLPLVLLTSSDGITWEPISTIGSSVYRGSEISIQYKDGKLYIASRDESHGVDWFTFDLTTNTVLKSGNFGFPQMKSRPYTFKFHEDVYMAVNTNPSWFGYADNTSEYTLDARMEVNVYKIVDDEPKLFRVINNPEGLNYHSWTPTPIYSNMHSQQAIYCAYSEDRRHLFRRQFGNVSVADVTPLFVDMDKPI